MARSKSSAGLFGWLFGRKKRKRAKKSNVRRYVWMFLAFVTGSGGIAGASEYEVLRGLWNIIRDRLQQQQVAPVAAPSDDSGAIRVYFTRPDQSPQAGDIAHAVAGYVDTVRESLDVCAFELDNRVIIDAIVRAARRGVRVRLVTETNYIGEVGVRDLQAAGVPVVDDRRDGALMHNKFMVFDRKAVWTGSMNFTENCAYRNNNHGVYIEDAKLVENYATKFAWMFDHHKFGPAPSKFDRIPNPVITLADGTQVENYFAPHDRPASKVMETLKLARKSVHFMAFSFTHDGIGQAMLAKAANGVEVSGVFEKTQTAGGHSEYFKMKEAGLAVFLDGNPRNMHHKAIVIDGEIVVCGSFNFSDSADRSNDENLLIIYNRAVAAKFEDEFQRVRQVALEADRK
ncbi:MAG TPA: phospholipase D-like domain-containing protein [Gemmataceae bacterium]|nr:phospholipase D-like domain-containing protein [Gemmataceae bacterium]